METLSKKLPGISLLAGALMAVLTMTLHPLGGSMEHIVKIKSVLIISHSIAVACTPFIAFGLWNLSKQLEMNSSMATLSFFVAMMGLAAATLAGTINGLVLPQFASQYIDKNLDMVYLKAILDYGRLFNKSLAYIFISSIATSISLWSLILIKKDNLIKWMGYFGLLVFAFGIVALFSDVNMTSVSFLGIFIFSIAGWLLVMSIQLLRGNLDNDSRDRKPTGKVG